MAPHHSDGSQVENGTAGAAALLREIEALRRRLAAVEARLPESASAQPSERRQAKARSSAKRVVRLTTGAGLAMLAGGALAYGADALIIGPDGATIFAKSINFGTRLGALLTLYDPGYTIGIQPGTFYQRSYKNFAWYKGGGRTDTELDPGGGSKMMSLTEGNLDVAGTVKAKSLDVDGAGNVTAGTVTTGTLTTGTLTVPAAMLEVNGGLLHVADNTGAPTVTSQGAYLGWNALTRATGETDFINNQGGGSGGFAFMNTPSSGTPRTPLMVISGAGNVEVTGTVKAQSVDGNMKVVYQRDDQEQTTYQKPLWRYHMTLTAAQYGGRTKTIPKEILTKLCGTRDGCEVRLGDTRWDNASRTETESVVNRFYYSPNDGHWRVSWPRNTEGIIGTGATQEAMNTSGQCIFTDGTFNNYEDQGDKNTGMQLYVAGRNSALTCELTIIP